MTWTQVSDPLNSTALSALVAFIPIAVLFWALIIRKMKGYKASLLAAGIALLIAIAVYGMPVPLALLSAGHGVLYGLFPICWIVLCAVFLFNVTVKSGQFEVIKHFMATITDDRRLQALLIAFSFGSFLEGTAGFGAPVAITAAMLVGLGFQPLYAAGICLIANTAPVAFGAIGTPILVAGQVSGIPDMAISEMVGRTLPLLSLFVPLYLVVLMSGFRRALEVWPAILVCGGTFAGLQWLTSNYLGPTLPDIISGIGSILALMVFLRFWKPKRVWRFADEPVAAAQHEAVSYTGGQIFRAWSPFIILTVMMLAWGMAPVKALLDRWVLVTWEVPYLHEAIMGLDGHPLAQVFKLNVLSAAGTGILLAAVISLPLIGVGAREGARVFGDTFRQLRFPIVTIGTVLGFAFIVNDSGITLSMANGLAATGALFPFFSPMLGWLGVFITGSDTSANALFSKLQATTAHSIGVDPVVTVGANVSGGVVGKMISPQSIAVAAAAGGLVGKESELFRFTVKHSFILLFIVCVVVSLQAYVFTWILPEYTTGAGQQSHLSVNGSEGYLYLGVLAAVLIGIVAIIMTSKKRRYI